MRNTIAVVLVIAALTGGLIWYFLNQWSRGPVQTLAPSAEAASRFSAKVLQLTSPAPPDGEASVVLSELEINSYLALKLTSLVPRGVRELQVQLGARESAIKALVDFDELKRDSNVKSNVLIDGLLRGQHQLRIKGTFESEDYTGKYVVTSVRLDQNELPPQLIDLLTKRLKLRYQIAKPNTPFNLPGGIRKIEVQSGKLVVHRSSRPQK
ncbi:MAG: hypothetical protein AB1898_22245 [Acidobacteriota bacterium]